MPKMQTEKERLAIIETKVATFEKMVDSLFKKLDKSIVKLDNTLNDHEDNIRELIDVAMGEIKQLKKDLEVVITFSRHPWLARGILLFLYLFTFKEVRDVIFGFM